MLLLLLLLLLLSDNKVILKLNKTTECDVNTKSIIRNPMRCVKDDFLVSKQHFTCFFKVNLIQALY